jgi:hypothetical protein
MIGSGAREADAADAATDGDTEGETSGGAGVVDAVDDGEREAVAETDAVAAHDADGEASTDAVGVREGEALALLEEEVVGTGHFARMPPGVGLFFTVSGKQNCGFVTTTPKLEL